MWGGVVYWTVLYYHPYLVSMLCFMLSSLPCFYAFCWSAIPTSCYILMFFILHASFSSICMLELKFAIYARAASLLSHRLPMQCWLKNHRLSSNTPHAPTVFVIQQSYVSSLLSDLCACVHVNNKWRSKGSHSSSVSGSNRLVWLTWKKRWAGALPSAKWCRFVRKPSRKSHANLN